MKRSLFFLVLITIFALSGCMDRVDSTDECEQTDSCEPSEITQGDAYEYFVSYIMSEMDSSISSNEHCNEYYTTDIPECISKRDQDLSLHFELTLHSFTTYTNQEDTYKVGVTYEDDETAEFLEYHIILFYRNEEDDIRFSIEQSSHQYDVEDYTQLAIDYAVDVMSDLSAGAVCSYYVLEEQSSECITEIDHIRENFVSMDYVAIQLQEGFYTITYQFNNGDYDENIGYHFQFIVTDDDQLKMSIYS